MKPKVYKPLKVIKVAYFTTGKTTNHTLVDMKGYKV